jgi:translation initiation factor IF-3
MEIVGIIKLINATESFGAAGFRKRELVITTEDQYPQMIMIEFMQDKCELLDNYIIGQKVQVSINLRGREWINPQGEAKYFNSVQGWRVETLQP